MNGFHFLHPLWLLVIPPALLLLLAAHRRTGQQNIWHAVCDAHLLAALREPRHQQRFPVGLIVAAATIVLAAIALAGPAWVKIPKPLHKPQLSRVVVLDLSQSMNAQDVSPSRLFMARLKLRDLLAQTTARTALIAFAGEPFLIAPLSDDAQTIAAMVDGLSTDLMPVQGTALIPALEMAKAVLQRDGSDRGDILLITDAADFHGEVAATVAALAPHPLSILAIGTEVGAPVLDSTGQPLLSADGTPVHSMADLAQAQALATGQFTPLTDDDQDINLLLLTQNTATSGATNLDGGAGAVTWRDEGPWLLLVLVPLVSVLFRRGWSPVATACLAITIAWPSPPAMAAGIDAWWQTGDQQGAEAFAAGDYARAARLFNDRRWRGLARYRQGDYAGALNAFKAGSDSVSRYNRATLLARLGRFHDALAEFDRLLALAPDHTDAKFNRALVSSILSTLDNHTTRVTNNTTPELASAAPEQPAQTPNSAADSLVDEAPKEQGNSPMDHSGGTQPPPDAALSAANSPAPSQERGQGDHSDDNESGGNNRAGAADSTGYSADGERTRTGGGGDGGVDLNAEGISHGERRQALEQWLRRIPDDPSGLIRRKLILDYKRRLRDRGLARAPRPVQPW